MGKISTDTLLSRRIQKRERIKDLENLIARSRSQIADLVEKVDQIEAQVLDNMVGVQDITFEED